MFSVVIIVKGRREQLANVLESCKRSTCSPHDIQIISMDGTGGIAQYSDLSVYVTDIHSGDALPLAYARNEGLRLAQTNKIIFLDVDCIVSPTLFETMIDELTDGKVISAYPKYLRRVPSDGSYETHAHDAIDHPSRKDIPAGIPVNHLKFWSLIFGITRNDFDKSGGFDERFTGYGGEDTDFAMSFNQRDIQLIFIKDYVLHQYHDKYDPPFNHFLAIISNATRYKQKWGVYPMMAWLTKFYDAGLIDDPETGINLRVLRMPTDAQIAAAKSTMPY